MKMKAYEVINPYDLSNRLYECKDRDLLFESQDFLNFFENELRTIYERYGRVIVSCDIFDTILLRNEKSESFRFYEIAKDIKKELNLKIDVYNILLARYLGTEITYSASTIKDGCREGSLYDIHKSMIRTLGLNEFLLEKTIEIETNYEKRNLRLNVSLWNKILDLHKEIGLEIILVSDMYKHIEQLKVLLEYFIPKYKNKTTKVYSSADTIISKHSGKIFKYIENELNIEGKYILHIGDNLQSDYINPKKNGWNALFLPIPKYVQEQIREDLILFKKQLDENNIRIEQVDRYFKELK